MPPAEEVYKEERPLKGQCIMVTGASRGIGAATASHLARLGARVALTYTSRPDLAREVMAHLSGKDHLLLSMNVEDPSSVRAGFEKMMKHFPHLSALINNAGITKDGLLLRMREEDFDQVLRVNLYGAFYCSKEAARRMVKQRKGCIIHVSSVVAQTGNPGQINYTASKAGLEGMTRSMARELAPRHIRVNAVAPGLIETDIIKTLSQEQQSALRNSVPLKRMGQAQEVAQGVAFLLQAKYITGQVLAINGGMAM